MKDDVRADTTAAQKRKDKARTRSAGFEGESVHVSNVIEHSQKEAKLIKNGSSARQEVSAKAKNPLSFVRRLPKLSPSSALADAVRKLPVTKVSPFLWSFIGLVLVPSFAAIIYFAFLASDQPAAEARFTVRQIDTDPREFSAASGTTDHTKSSGRSSTNYSFTVSGQNAYIVTAYIESRAIIDDLNGRLDLRAIFRRPEADFWMRLEDNASIEDLTDYWKSMVITYTDSLSGIVTLRVRAFTPDDAVTLARNILELSEILVNRISDRARRDAMAKSEEEVRRTYEMMRQALGELHKFRDSAGMIDPVQSGTETGKLLLGLLTERIQLENELFVASRSMSDSAPTVRALKTRLESAERQIADLKGRLTSTQGDQTTLAAALAKFEEIELQRQFAEKLYTLAQADLDRARQRAERQSLYLTVFVKPSLPEESRYPRRIAFPILIFLGLAILWAIGAMTLASIEDHRL